MTVEFTTKAFVTVSKIESPMTPPLRLTEKS